MTAQFPERIIQNGVVSALCTEPLRPYLESLAVEEPPRFNEKGYTTALWRGYVGHWDIENGRLRLTALHDFEGEPIDEARIFDGRRLPMVATWFTGRLQIMGGKLLRYVHHYWASVYQTERVIRVREGVVIGEFVVDHVARIRREMEEEMSRRRIAFDDVLGDPDRLHTTQGLTDDGLELVGLPRREPRGDEADEDDGYVIGACYISRRAGEAAGD